MKECSGGSFSFGSLLVLISLLSTIDSRGAENPVSQSSPGAATKSRGEKRKVSAIESPEKTKVEARLVRPRVLQMLQPKASDRQEQKIPPASTPTSASSSVPSSVPSSASSSVPTSIDPSSDMWVPFHKVVPNVEDLAKKTGAEYVDEADFAIREAGKGALYTDRVNFCTTVHLRGLDKKGRLVRILLGHKSAGCPLTRKGNLPVNKDDLRFLHDFTETENGKSIRKIQALYAGASRVFRTGGEHDNEDVDLMETVRKYCAEKGIELEEGTHRLRTGGDLDFYGGLDLKTDSKLLGPAIYTMGDFDYHMKPPLKTLLDAQGRSFLSFKHIIPTRAGLLLGKLLLLVVNSTGVEPLIEYYKSLSSEDRRLLMLAISIAENPDYLDEFDLKFFFEEIEFKVQYYGPRYSKVLNDFPSYTAYFTHLFEHRDPAIPAKGAVRAKEGLFEYVPMAPRPIPMDSSD